LIQSNKKQHPVKCGLMAELVSKCCSVLHPLWIIRCPVTQPVKTWSLPNICTLGTSWSVQLYTKFECIRVSVRDPSFIREQYYMKDMSEMTLWWREILSKTLYNKANPQSVSDLRQIL